MHRVSKLKVYWSLDAKSTLSLAFRPSVCDDMLKVCEHSVSQVANGSFAEFITYNSCGTAVGDR